MFALLFSIGSLELLAIILIAVPTFVMYFRRDARCRWFFAVLVCMALASITTPADVASTAVMFPAFLSTFMMGARYRVHGFGPAN